MDFLDALTGWSMHDGPLYRCLATGIANAVRRGDLPPGYRLPPERALAASLAVGRTTVVTAYELLRERGTLASRQGSGTWVAGADHPSPPSRSAPDSLREAVLDRRTDLVDLATASLPAPELLAVVLRELAGGLQLDRDSTVGYVPSGHPSLREEVAHFYSSRGLPTTADQVLITTGIQQGLSLLIQHLLGTGDTVLIEDPTSPGMIDLVRSHPLIVRTCASVSAGGADPVLEVVSVANPRMVYLQPSLGAEGQVADPREVERLARGLDRFAGVVIEDENSRYLSFGRTAPYLACSSAGNVVTVGSMSKVYWAGLRIGWLRADPAMVSRLARLKARQDGGSPLLSQLLSASLLRQFEDVRKARVDDLQDRMRHAEDVIRALLPELTWTQPHGGLTIWAGLPRGSSRPFTETARRCGVAVVAGEALSAGGASDGHLRLSLGSSKAEFVEGAHRLSRAWSMYRDGRDPTNKVDRSYG